MELWRLPCRRSCTCLCLRIFFPRLPTCLPACLQTSLIAGFLILFVGGWYCNRLLKKMAMEQDLKDQQEEIRKAASALEVG